MASYQFNNRSCVVATAASAARAELIQMTLAAHGISATLAVPSVYPSVDFVEGVRVFVADEDEERAKSVVSALGLGDETPDEGG